MVKIQMREVYKMRLYNTYYLCKNLMHIFNNTRLKNIGDGKIYVIEGWAEYKSALESLHQVPMFQKITDEIYESVPVYVRENDEPQISMNAKNAFVQKNKELSKRMEIIIELYESMELRDRKNGIDVKIPNCSDLKQYIGYLKELDFIFTQCPYLLCEDEKIQFDSVDVGSNWLSFIVEVSAGAAATFYILNNIALLIDKVLILKSHYKSIAEQEEQLKIAQNKTELTKEEIKIFEILRKSYMRDAITALEEEIEPLADGEERGKLEKSLEKLNDLLDKGVEIYASLDVPKDVQLLFPELGETKKLPDTILKFIEDKNTEEE